MMVLRIYIEGSAGGEYAYDEDTGLTAGAVEVATALNERVIETTDVDLEVAAPFLGASSLLDLPDDYGRGWRAVLESSTPAGPVVLLDGLVYASDVEYYSESDTFGIRVVGGAEEEMWRRLDAVRVRTLFDDGDLTDEDYEAVQTYTVRAMGQPPWAAYIEGAGADPRLPSRRAFVPLGRRAWWSFAAVCRACAQAAEAVEAPSDLTLYEYGDGETAPRRVARPHLYQEHTWRRVVGEAVETNTLPSWTGREAWETAAMMGAWRIRAAWDAYPGRTIRVAVYADTWQERAGGVALEAAMQRGGYVLATDNVAAGDFAVRFANEIGEASLETLPANLHQYWGGGFPPGPGLPPPYYAVSIPPPPEAVYAAERWAMEVPRDPEEVSRTPDNADLVSLPLRLPQAMARHQHNRWRSVSIDLGYPPPSPEADAWETAELTLGAYSETLRLAAPVVGDQSDAVHVCALHGGRMVVERHPAGSSQVLREVSAEAVYANYGLSRSVHRVLETRVALDAPPGTPAGSPAGPLPLAVGDPASTAEALGLAWLAQAVEVDVRGETAALTLVRPQAPAPEAGGPGDQAPVVSLSGAWVAWQIAFSANTGDQRDFLRLRWEPPPPLGSRHTEYHVWLRRAGEPDFQLLARTRATEMFWAVDGGSEWRVMVTSPPTAEPYAYSEEYVIKRPD